MLRGDKHYLSVVVSYKMEQCNLLEWLEYHIHVGVNHFYIYNNDDNPKLSDRLMRPYVEEGYVTNIHSARMFRKPVWSRQSDANLDAISRFGQNTRWMALLDMDEFLYPVVDPTVSEALRRYHDCPSLAVSYYCFGSGGHRLRPRLQIDGYRFRSYEAFYWNNHTKSIGQTALVGPHPHHHRFSGPLLDEDKVLCKRYFKPPKGKILRINHYMARSHEDFQEKMIRGNPYKDKRDWSWYVWADRNEVYDDGMARRFAGPVWEAIRRRGKLFDLSRGRVPL